MLYITLVDGREFGYHLGDASPLNAEDVPDILDIQADGHELEKILELFPTISSIRKIEKVMIFPDGVSRNIYRRMIGINTVRGIERDQHEETPEGWGVID